jgi:hypothetical protein
VRALALAVALSGCCLGSVQEQSPGDAGARTPGVDGGRPDASLYIPPIVDDAGSSSPIACTQYVAPTLPPACPSASAQLNGTLGLPTSQPVSSWALATNGSGEASLAFILGDTSVPLPWRVYLQRLSATGVPQGPLNEIDLPEWGALVALAVSPVAHVVCWENSSTTIACAAIPVGGGPVYPGVTVEGQLPGVAYGPAGFLFAYAATDGTVTVQPLDCSARASGAPIQLAGLVADALGLVASSEGYALVTGNQFPPAGQSAAFAQFFSAAGRPSGQPVPLGPGVNYTSGASLALSGGVLAVGGDLFDSGGAKGSVPPCTGGSNSVGLVAPAADSTFAECFAVAPAITENAALLSTVTGGYLLTTFTTGFGFYGLTCP